MWPLHFSCGALYEEAMLKMTRPGEGTPLEIGKFFLQQQWAINYRQNKVRIIFICEFIRIRSEIRRATN
jgi:hypothetical protein